MVIFLAPGLQFQSVQNGVTRPNKGLKFLFDHLFFTFKRLNYAAQPLFWRSASEASATPKFGIAIYPIWGVKSPNGVGVRVGVRLPAFAYSVVLASV